jgi:hypothetical protein
VRINQCGKAKMKPPTPAAMSPHLYKERKGGPATRRCRQCQRENSTSADFCLILPDQGALELLRGECGRGSSVLFPLSILA